MSTTSCAFSSSYSKSSLSSSRSPSPNPFEQQELELTHQLEAVLNTPPIPLQTMTSTPPHSIPSQAGAYPSNPNPVLANTSMSVSYITGNLSIRADAARPNPVASSSVAYSIQKGPVIGPKEEHDLINLTSTLNLSSRISYTRDAFSRTDLLGAFSIVYPVTPGSVALQLSKGGITPKKADLFTNYRHLNAMDVANSCAWYSTYAAVDLPDGTVTTLQQELGWSYQHFCNHVELELYRDVNKLFTKYSEIQRGGPLFLWLLLDALTVTNDDSLHSLITKAAQYNIKRDIPSEDITQVTQILTNLTETIASIQYEMEHPLPDLYLE
eukprot:jgi/Psemu1/285350/fgenesh1_pg.82_\